MLVDVINMKPTNSDKHDKLVYVFIIMYNLLQFAMYKLDKCYLYHFCTKSLVFNDKIKTLENGLLQHAIHAQMNFFVALRMFKKITVHTILIYVYVDILL